MTERQGQRDWHAALLVWGMRAAARLPWRFLAACGAALGEVAYWLAPRARRVGHINLRLCFPELSPPARRRWLRAHFRALGGSSFTLPIAWWGAPERLKRLVRVRDRAQYDAIIGAGRAVILLAPHFVALDIGGMRLSLERPIVSMYRAPKWQPLARAFAQRERANAVLFERDGPLKRLIKLVREGRPFYYLPDQDPGGAPHVFAPFFNVPTATLTALARMAQMTGAAVIPCATALTHAGAEVRLWPALEGFPSGDAAADAAHMNRAIETMVRAYPAQYLWIYKRFKTRPGGGRAPYDV